MGFTKFWMGVRLWSNAFYSFFFLEKKVEIFISTDITKLILLGFGIWGFRVEKRGFVGGLSNLYKIGGGPFEVGDSLSLI